MATRYNVTPELRVTLKQPLGALIRGSFDETMKRFKEKVQTEKPSSIISVGDTVSKNLAKNHIASKLSIIDNKCMRRSTISTSFPPTMTTVNIRNPQGTITDEAISAIKSALGSNRQFKIVVDGEEDLLALIAIQYAAENSFVIYGQPHEGIVVVKVTPGKKGEVANILKSMEQHSTN